MGKCNGNISNIHIVEAIILVIKIAIIMSITIIIIVVREITVVASWGIAIGGQSGGSRYCGKKRLMMMVIKFICSIQLCAVFCVLIMFLVHTTTLVNFLL